MRYLPKVSGGERISGIRSLPAGDAPLWINSEGELTAGTNFSNTVSFSNVDSVTVQYESSGRRPNLTVFSVDVHGDAHEAFPVINYNTNTRTVLVSFGSALESGYIIVN
jgi:hypothetical protein